MPEPEGKVFYSPKANRFYQEGRRGAVSRQTAISFLEYDEEKRVLRDQRGMGVPLEAIAAPGRQVIRTLGRDRYDRPFLTIEFTDKLITEDEAVQMRLESNEMLNVRVVVRTADGKVHVFAVASKLGGRPNIEDLKAEARKRATAELRAKGYDVNTNDVEKSVLRVDFSRRKMQVLK